MSENKKQRVAITNPVEKRVAMVNGMFNLPDDTLQAMRDIRTASDAYARALHEVFSREGVEADTGRSIATMDAIQASKNMACDAVILPHASKEVDE